MFVKNSSFDVVKNSVLIRIHLEAVNDPSLFDEHCAGVFPLGSATGTSGRQAAIRPGNPTG